MAFVHETVRYWDQKSLIHQIFWQPKIGIGAEEFFCQVLLQTCPISGSEKSYTPNILIPIGNSSRTNAVSY